MDAISVSGLSKYYGKKIGVENVDFTVSKGEKFGFIGPNGAGKSTTIRMLMQLLHPSGGEISLLGKTLGKEDPDIRSRIGYLPSEVQYDSDMNGHQVLKFAARAYGLNLKDTMALEIAERLQLDLNRKVRDYSLGNRKKLGIVQCLQHRPELAVLDEPTSGLDPLIQHEFFNLLTELNEKGMTVFFSTHVLSEVERFCDRVAFIREGHLLRVSRVDEIAERLIRKFTVAFREKGNLIERLELNKLDSDAKYEHGEHIFQVSGPIEPVLHLLADEGVNDLRVERPSLEEIFMQDYSVHVGTDHPHTEGIQSADKVRNELHRSMEKEGEQ